MHKLNIYCLNTCDFLDIYPPIHQTQFPSLLFVNKYPSNSTESSETIQIYAPLGINEYSFECGDTLSASECDNTAVYCGLQFVNKIHPSNPEECVGAASFYNQYINNQSQAILPRFVSGDESTITAGIGGNEFGVIMYIPPIDGIITYRESITINCESYGLCVIICIDGTLNIGGSPYDVCIDSVIYGNNTADLIIWSNHFIGNDIYGGYNSFKYFSGFSTIVTGTPNIQQNNYYLGDINNTIYFDCSLSDYCLLESNLYITDVQVLSIYTNDNTQDTNIYADFEILPENQTLPDNWDIFCSLESNQECQIDIHFIDAICEHITEETMECVAWS